jgi:hypothetical protein
MNHIDHDDLYDLAFRVCVAAVKEAFPHIPVRDIITPPRNQFDAILARQIVLHIMVARFGLTKAGAGSLFGRARVSVNRALDVIDARLEEAEFETAYRAMANRALSMFDDEQMEAA